MVLGFHSPVGFSASLSFLINKGSCWNQSVSESLIPCMDACMINWCSVFLQVPECRLSCSSSCCYSKDVPCYTVTLSIDKVFEATLIWSITYDIISLCFSSLYNFSIHALYLINLFPFHISLPYISISRWRRENDIVMFLCQTSKTNCRVACKSGRADYCRYWNHKSLSIPYATPPPPPPPPDVLEVEFHFFILHLPLIQVKYSSRCMILL